MPRNAVSTWFKNKEKLNSSLEKGESNSKRKKSHDGEFEDMDKAFYLWFETRRSQQVSIDGVLLKEKTLNFTEELGETDCFSGFGSVTGKKGMIPFYVIYVFMLVWKHNKSILHKWGGLKLKNSFNRDGCCKFVRRKASYV